MSSLGFVCVILRLCLCHPSPCVSLGMRLLVASFGMRLFVRGSWYVSFGMWRLVCVCVWQLLSWALTFGFQGSPCV